MSIEQDQLWNPKLKALPHKCEPYDYDSCRCSIQGLEPDDRCPIHSGFREYPARCKCGRYVKREATNDD